MTTAEDKIAQYLQEAHAMELALARTLQAHGAMTPRGAYRSALDRHLRETRGHADALEHRLRELDRFPGLAERGVGLAQRLAGQLLALGMAPLHIARGRSPEEKLLKNAKDECASEAQEIATYEALEAFAEQVGDERTAALAADIRGDEERMLGTLREQLPTLAEAVTDAELRGHSRFDVGSTGAAQKVRETRRAAGETARHAVHDAREATGTLSRTQEREEHRQPLPNYDELTVEEVVRQLGDLTPAQLRHVATYERVHKDRRGILDAVERQQEAHEREHATA